MPPRPLLAPLVVPSPLAPQLLRLLSSWLSHQFFSCHRVPSGGRSLRATSCSSCCAVASHSSALAYLVRLVVASPLLTLLHPLSGFSASCCANASRSAIHKPFSVCAQTLRPWFCVHAHNTHSSCFNFLTGGHFFGKIRAPAMKLYQTIVPPSHSFFSDRMGLRLLRDSCEDGFKSLLSH